MYFNTELYNSCVIHRCIDFFVQNLQIKLCRQRKINNGKENDSERKEYCADPFKVTLFIMLFFSRLSVVHVSNRIVAGMNHFIWIVP